MGDPRDFSHAHAKLRPGIQRVDRRLLVVALASRQQTPVGRGFRPVVDTLHRVADLIERLDDFRRQGRLLRQVHRRRLEARVRLQLHLLEVLERRAARIVRDEDISGPLLVAPPRAAQSVDVLVGALRGADLDDVRDLGEVHAAGDDVGGEEDRAGRFAEGVAGVGAGDLREPRVDLEDGGRVQQVPALAFFLQGPEDAVGELDFGGGLEEDDRFEGGSGVFFGELAFAELEQGGHVVLDADAGYGELGDTVVGLFFAVLDGSDCLMARKENFSDQT